jgi:hypothetical protein
MKIINLFLVAFFLSIAVLQAQVKALSETGNQVLLYDNNTWELVEAPIEEVIEIPFNNQEFKKSANATSFLKSEIIPVGLYIDPTKWNFNLAVATEFAEYEFQLKTGNLYGMLITEKIGMTLEDLRNAAIVNAKAVSSDLEIVKEEYRIVNGIKMLLLQLEGTSNGGKFSYYGYYHSNHEGTLQLITYSAQNIAPDFLAVCEEFLNGLVLFQ